MGMFSFDEQLDYNINYNLLSNVDYIIMLKALTKKYSGKYVEIGPYTIFVSDLCKALIKKLNEENI